MSLVAAAMAVGVAHAQEQSADESIRDARGVEAEAVDPLAVSDDAWRFEVVPYLWALSMDGNMTVEGFPVSVSLGFDTIFEHLDGAGMLEIRATHEDWFFTLAGLAAKFGFDDGADVNRDVSIGRPILGIDLPIDVDASVSIDISLAVGEFRVGRVIHDSPIADAGTDGRAPRFVVAPYAGVRYTYFETQVGVTVNETIGPITAGRRSDSTSVSSGWTCSSGSNWQ